MRISDWSSDVCSSDLPAIAIDNADLGLEIGMFAEAAAFEHIAKLLLAPAPARLGRVAQRVDELRRLARHTLAPLAHRRDLALEQAEGVAPFGLDLTDRFLIFLHAFVFRVQQGIQFFPRGSIGITS